MSCSNSSLSSCGSSPLANIRLNPIDPSGTSDDVGSVDMSSPFDFIVFVSSSSAVSNVERSNTDFKR